MLGRDDGPEEQPAVPFFDAPPPVGRLLTAQQAVQHPGGVMARPDVIPFIMGRVRGRGTAQYPDAGQPAGQLAHLPAGGGHGPEVFARYGGAGHHQADIGLGYGRPVSQLPDGDVADLGAGVGGRPGRRANLRGEVRRDPQARGLIDEAVHDDRPKLPAHVGAKAARLYLKCFRPASHEFEPGQRSRIIERHRSKRGQVCSKNDKGTRNS